VDNLEVARLRLELDRAIYRLLGVIKILNQVEDVLLKGEHPDFFMTGSANTEEIRPPSSSR
jgi:hypothetical protein